MSNLTYKLNPRSGRCRSALGDNVGERFPKESGSGCCADKDKAVTETQSIPLQEEIKIGTGDGDRVRRGRHFHENSEFAD